MSTQCTNPQKAICNTNIVIRHEMSQVAEKTWPPMARRRPNRTNVGSPSVQNNPSHGTCHINHKKSIEKHSCDSDKEMYIKYKPKLVRYRNDITSFFTKFTPRGVTAVWYLSINFISNILVNKVPRIREITGSSTKYGNNRSKSNYPIFTCTYRTMRPPALEPVTLTAFIPLRYTYRSMPYIGLSTGTNKHNSRYQ